MYAVVKNIKIGTKISDKNHSDKFTMENMIGKKFKFEPAFTGKTWFASISKDDDCDGFNFHKSWLEFV